MTTTADRPKLLDLFCCDGGCSMGYHDAGFDITGVDIVPRLSYPFPFIEADAMEVLTDHDFLNSFDVVHASPPCQRYSVAVAAWGNADTHPDLVPPTREALRAWGGPYLIENVPTAPMDHARRVRVRCVEPTGNGSATSTQPGEKPTASTSGPTPEVVPYGCDRRSSPPTDPTAPAAASPSQPSSPSTTSTAEAPSIASRSTARSTTSSDATASLPVTESFAGIATGLIGWGAVRIDRTTEGFIWPEDLPEVVAGGSTVAQNVLTWGTGALNIDATRIEYDGTPGHAHFDGKQTQGDASSYGAVSKLTPPHAAGRWPANVVLDQTQADALDQQSGFSTSPPIGSSCRSSTSRDGVILGKATPAVRPNGHGDSGGASRFFYVAKAPKKERPNVDGTAHPTVKPLTLMRWLVRLVTPPGGTILDPFGGSGTTGEAALLEGFDAVLIEREADYLPLIAARLARHDTDGPAPTVAELDLLDLIDEGPAA